MYPACESTSVGASVVFYGFHPNVQPNLSALEAPVLGVFAEKDEIVPPAAASQLEVERKDAGKTADVTIFEEADHACFNDSRRGLSRGARRHLLVADARLFPRACPIAGS